MSEVVYELICDSCGADYELRYVEGIIDRQDDGPMYCPFCSAEVDLTDVVDEDLDDLDDDMFDELDFDDK